MTRMLLLSAAALMIVGGTAFADPIEGDWKTKSGNTAEIARCGNSFCITLKTGQHAGKQIGKMAAEGNGKYSGKVTDPANDKTYSGKGNLGGDTFEMKGCVLGGLICRGETWTRL